MLQGQIQGKSSTMCVALISQYWAWQLKAFGTLNIYWCCKMTGTWTAVVSTWSALMLNVFDLHLKIAQKTFCRIYVLLGLSLDKFCTFLHVFQHEWENQRGKIRGFYDSPEKEQSCLSVCMYFFSLVTSYYILDCGMQSGNRGREIQRRYK